MKSFRFEMTMLLLPVMLFTACVEDEIRDHENVSLTFNFELKENKEGRTTSTQISPGASVLISVEMSNGELVVDQQEVGIQKDADGYVTAPLQLPEGNYRLVDFMVVGESGEILYVMPRQGSVLSKIALSSPHKFAITSKEVFDNRIGVVDTKAKTAKDFGYESFRRKPHSLKIQVYIKKDKKLLSASAEALIMKGLDTVRMYQLSEKMNLITFSGDPAETYSLVVVKDSYSRFSQNLDMQRVQGKPLKVILEPAFTVVGVPVANQNYFAIQMMPGWKIFEFMVDWGDGTVETWISDLPALEHYYQQPGQYFISITGHGLDSVVYVGNVFDGGRIARLGMAHLVNLHDFRIEYARGPKVIDLSNNKSLYEIRIFTNSSDESPLEDLMIPNNASIHTLEIGGHKNMKPESFNELINNLYQQVVNNPLPGEFWYSVWTDGNIPMVTPSSEALAKMRDLKNTYHWQMVPDPDMLTE